VRRRSYDAQVRQFLSLWGAVGSPRRSLGKKRAHMRHHTLTRVDCGAMVYRPEALEGGDKSYFHGCHAARPAKLLDERLTRGYARRKVAIREHVWSLPWTVRVRDGRVIHHVEVSLFPNWRGTDQERFVDVDGDRLTITTAPLQIGGTTSSRLAWERAR
jgi:hypothetical protein